MKYADTQDQHEEAQRKLREQLEEANACRAKDDAIEYYKSMAMARTQEIETQKLKILELE